MSEYEVHMKRIVHYHVSLFTPWKKRGRRKSLNVQGWIQSSSSDLHKSLKFFPNLISQLFIAVDEINYPPCFIVYYEIKQLRDYPVDHTANPAPPERSGLVTVRAVSSFVDLSRTTRKEIRRHDRTKFLPRG